MTESQRIKEGFFRQYDEQAAPKGGARMQRERKRRLIYAFWGVLCVLVLLVALPTFRADPWPRPLAHDQVLLATRWPQEELLQFDTHQEGIINSRPWSGSLIGVPKSGRDAAGVWRYSRWELEQFRPPEWRSLRSIEFGESFITPVFTPDGDQVQLNLADIAEQIRWIDLATGSHVGAEVPCRSDMARLLQPLRRDEAILLCLWELWSVSPTDQRPLLTAAMDEGSTNCLRYVGHPFGVAIDPKRKRIWVTGDGGLLCQIDPTTGVTRHVATLPIRESERVNLTHLQYAPETDLLYIGVHRWDTDRLDRLLVWDLQQNRLRSELPLTNLKDFRLASDGAHVIGLTEDRPGEFESRLIVIEAATSRVMRELGQLKGVVLDWAVLPQ